MFREPDGVAASFGRGKCCVNETFPFINSPFLAQRIDQMGEDFAQDRAVTPLLKPAMQRFVIRLALG